MLTDAGGDVNLRRPKGKHGWWIGKHGGKLLLEETVGRSAMADFSELLLDPVLSVTLQFPKRDNCF